MKRLCLALVAVTFFGCGGYQLAGTSPEDNLERRASSSSPSSRPAVPWRFLEAVEVTPADKVERPYAVSQVPVQYSESARKQRITGVVGLEVTVDAEGNVTDVVLRQPLDPSLDANAVETVRRWKYSPARLNGVARPSVLEVEVNFQIV